MNRIYWKYSRKILILSLFISIILPILSFFWILAKFDLPFIHSGDKLPVIIILFLWWLFTTIFIFGWDIKTVINLDNSMSKSKKKLIIFILFIFLLFPFKSAISKEKIHPINKRLMQLYPRKQKLWFPWLPRIDALSALQLYKAGLAFFIHIGDEGGNVPGSIHLTEKVAWKVNPNRLFKKLRRYKYVILYCN